MPEQKQRLKFLHICKAFVLGIVAMCRAAQLALNIDHRGMAAKVQCRETGVYPRHVRDIHKEWPDTHTCVPCSIMWKPGVKAILCDNLEVGVASRQTCLETRRLRHAWHILCAHLLLDPASTLQYC